LILNGEQACIIASPKRVISVKKICRSLNLGLPTTLKELKLAGISYEELLKVGTLASKEGETIHQMGIPITAESVTDALLCLDQYVRTNFPKIDNGM